MQSAADLRNLFREVVKFIIVANSREDKLQSLTELRDMIEQLKVTIIICKEVKAVSPSVALPH